MILWSIVSQKGENNGIDFFSVLGFGFFLPSQAVAHPKKVEKKPDQSTGLLQWQNVPNSVMFLVF